MHIIIGKQNVEHLGIEKKFVVLELDTFRLPPNGEETTAYCVVENIPITDMDRIDSMKDMHHNLMINYRKKDWNYCRQALDVLTGFWGQELDSFYQTLKERIDDLAQQDLAPDWNGSLVRI